MSKIKFCPKCMNIIHKKDTKCSNCGMLVSDMEKEERVENKLKTKKEKHTVFQDENGNVISKKEYKKRLIEKEIDFEKEFYETDENSDRSETLNGIEKDELNKTTVDESHEVEEKKTQTKRHKHKPKKKNAPKFSVDDSGKYDIDTKDVTFFEGQEEYSVRKARGDYKEEKIEWWEIYKWADRMLARRKVKKEVNKAATVRPEFISKAKQLILCGLFGWMGAHNFYAKNKAKGWTILSMFVVMLVVIYVPALYEIMGVFIGGGFGFVILTLWMYDFFAICFNKYKYRISKMQFIKKLNVETRAKLGKKYINIK